MPLFRVYIEETSIRLFMATVTAKSQEAADALAQAALDNDEWTTWDHSSADCAVEPREDLTEEVPDDEEN